MSIPLPSMYLKQLQNPKFPNRDNVIPLRPGMAAWQIRHRDALMRPDQTEAGILQLLSSWAMYADSHRIRCGSGIGADRVLGAGWAKIGASIREMMIGAGTIGRLDCETLDAFVRDTLAAEGLDSQTQYINDPVSSEAEARRSEATTVVDNRGYPVDWSVLLRYVAVLGAIAAAVSALMRQLAGWN